MKQITIERLSTPDAKNKTGQRLKHDWNGSPFTFPPEYMEFLELFNGYDGWLGTSIVDLCQFEELIELNENNEMQIYFPGITMIGTNRGGTGYAINRKGQFVQFEQCSIDEPEILVDNFDDFVDYLYRS